jgi:alpha-L-glutamate ligase-like protein
MKKIHLQKLSNILGINRRNIEFIYAHNPRKYYPLADNKVKTKELLTNNDIPVSETILVVSTFSELTEAIGKLKTEKSSVIKPAKGRAGGGILIVDYIGEDQWKTPSGKIFSEDEIRYHLGEILFGVYSFGSLDDFAFIERRVYQHQFFDDIYPNGISDIRLILLEDQPVLAMLRVPTDRSDGKANLHQGAIGIPVDIDLGTTGKVIYKKDICSRHPDSGKEISGLTLPHWDIVVDLAKRASKVMPLNYIGIDILIDKDKGPLVLEINVRPGLEIQVVNNCGIIEKTTELLEAGRV